MKIASFVSQKILGSLMHQLEITREREGGNITPDLLLCGKWNWN
jgi:hypothetical protein